MTTEAAGTARPAPLAGTLIALRRGRAGPVLLVCLVLLGLWYLGAAALNADRVAQTHERAGTPQPGLGAFLDEAWSQDRPLLPAPHQVIIELNKTVFDKKITSKRSLVFHSWVTLSSTLLGFLMGTALGITLAVGIVYVRTLDRSLMPWIITSQTIPILAVAPMVIVVLGAIGLTGLVPKAIISMYLCFFPVVIGMVKGLRSPDPLQLDLMRTYSANRAQVFWKLRLPASLPFLFASLKVAIAISLVGAIVGELPTGAQAGLGARLLAGSYYGQTIQIWSALVMASLLAGALVALVGAVEGVVLRRSGAQP